MPKWCFIGSRSVFNGGQHLFFIDLSLTRKYASNLIYSIFFVYRFNSFVVFVSCTRFEVGFDCMNSADLAQRYAENIVTLSRYVFPICQSGGSKKVSHGYSDGSRVP